MIVLLALLVASLVKRRIRNFTEELHIFGLLLADQNRVLEVNMQHHDQFRIARLEQQMLDVRKQDV